MTFLVALAVFALAAWSGSVVVRGRALYEALGPGFRGWRGSVHGSDPVLGLRLVPGGRGAETFPIGPDVPSRIDADGFRVPLETPAGRERRRPRVLALGCSFTYGSACLAEDVFCERVARALDGTALNAGLCSGGAAQMLLLAERLIPLHEPDLVLVQYSPWLMERSQQAFAPTFFGHIPVPRFVRGAAGIELRPPAGDTIAFDLPVAEHAGTAAERGGLASFLARVAFPLFAHDDRLALRSWFSARFASAEPSATAEEIERHVYPRILELCRAGGARMVVVWLEGKPLGASWDLPDVVAELDVPVAIGTKRMIDELPVKTREEFTRAYTHMRGDPPVCVDGHPNPRAHALIAAEVLATLGAGGR